MSPRAATRDPVDRLRRRIGHPIVDVDAHLVEHLPALVEHLLAAGADFNLDRADLRLDRLLPGVFGPAAGTWWDASPDERRERRLVRGPWWGLPSDTFDLATAALPGLLHERLERLGLDFSVVYGSLGPGFAYVAEEEYRRAACRGVNRYYAELFAPYRDRLAPVAVIPMHTPAEAVEELEFAVTELGFKAAVFAGYVKRPVAAAVGTPAAPYATWLDTFGIDSPYDYDPVWATCQALGIPFAAHGGGIGWGSRQSTSSFTYNHIGHFAAAGEAVAKSLFLGGVTRRFPDLDLVFLEGGAAWAVSLFTELVGHWRKRNADAVEQYDPARFDADRFAELLATYGGPLASAPPAGALGVGWAGEAVDPADRDEWRACEIRTEADFGPLFAEPFHFGCEGDDPMTSWAFDRSRSPLGVPLRAVFGSDIGHWDVPDLTAVLADVWEPVERGWMTEADLADFTFTNPVRLYTRMNPDFFAGTVVEGPAGAVAAAVSP